MPTIRPALTTLCFAIALLTLGCEKKVSGPARENQRPTARFSRAPARSADLYSYSYTMEWTGFDPDGEVRRFDYAIDPPVPTAPNPEPDTAWVATTAYGGTFQFSATVPQPPAPGSALLAGYHSFALRAVDDRGLASLPVSVSFNASTVAPVARITTPAPSSRFRQYLPPSFVVEWQGTDLDGVTSQKPIYYKVKLLSGSTPITPALLADHPDTLIHYYQPRGWATWDSLGPEAHNYAFTTLAPLQDYAFVVIAFDEAGGYTPYASGDVNVLNFRALYANAGGPKLTIFNEFFSYIYNTGTYAPNDPKSEIRLEVPSGIPLTFGWFAKAEEGTYIKYYRWALDIENLDDTTPRTNERTDVTHWSTAADVTTATLEPFFTAGDHRFYIEVADGNGLRSLGIVHFTVVVGAFDKPLAICDDTRLLVDGRSPGATSCIDRPRGRFPTAAELDTFLFARGGFPIKCYPAGSVSRPGLFAGYPFDTLNMRIGKNDLTPSLALLSRYRRIVWLVDPAAPDNSANGANLADGMTTMRYMCSPLHLNVLAAYLRQGGEVWLAGGGSVGASVVTYNSGANDRPSRSYSSAYELIPGRIPYDFAHWRSEIRPAVGYPTITKMLGRRTGGATSYGLFPEILSPKSTALGDTMPPWRTNTGDFFVTSFTLEALTQPNSIVEDFDPGDGVDARSTLDTLFAVAGTSLPAGSVIMTNYEGLESPRVITTGFDLWSYNRAQLRQVVDGVLQGIWGLARTGPEAAPLAQKRAPGRR